MHFCCSKHKGKTTDPMCEGAATTHTYSRCRAHTDCALSDRGGCLVQLLESVQKQRQSVGTSSESGSHVFNWLFPIFVPDVFCLLQWSESGELRVIQPQRPLFFGFCLAFVLLFRLFIWVLKSLNTYKSPAGSSRPSVLLAPSSTPLL